MYTTQNEVHDVSGRHILLWKEGKQEKDSSGFFMNFTKPGRLRDHQNGENENFRSYKIAVKYFRLNFVFLTHENSQ